MLGIDEVLHKIHRHQHRMRHRNPALKEVSLSNYEELLRLLGKEVDGTASPHELAILNRAAASVVSFAE